MTNDLDTYLAFLRQVGVGYRRTIDKKRNYISITHIGQDHKNVGGYTGFSVDWGFDLDGKFLEMGVWE